MTQKKEELVRAKLVEIKNLLCRISGKDWSLIFYLQNQVKVKNDTVKELEKYLGNLKIKLEEELTHIREFEFKL